MNTKTLIIAILCPLFMFSQNISKKIREKIEVQKVAFITTQLDLTTAEAQVFWPVNNQFSEEMKVIYSEKRENRKDIKNMSDSEIAVMLENNFKIEQKELDVKKEYNLKFQKILPTKKVAKLYHARMQFKRELLRKIKKGEGNPNYKRKN